MVTTHSLGFSRIGAGRELKFALEAYWQGKLSATHLIALGAQLRQTHWDYQSALDYVPVGDFSFYDQVLDASFMLGNVPKRVCQHHVQSGQTEQEAYLESYFRAARGRSTGDTSEGCVHAGEMTKWFDTNYHYIVPEFDAQTQFKLDATRLLEQVAQAQQLNIRAKPVILGPISYLWLGKSIDESRKLDLLERLLPIYVELLAMLAARGIPWVQIDEPILVTELDVAWQRAFVTAYHALQSSNIKCLLATYFGQLKENLALICQLPIDGLHIDAINAKEEVAAAIEQLPKHCVLSLGVVNGRNIWKTNITTLLDWLEPVYQQLGERLWLAPSCSLLHVPVDLALEQHMDEDIRSWVAFARQKLIEIEVIAKALTHGRASIQLALDENLAAAVQRSTSLRVHCPDIKTAVAQISDELGKRRSGYIQRTAAQASWLKLPQYPTTTIGSFPQTAVIRQARKQHRLGQIDVATYTQLMQEEIAHCVYEQELLGLDVLVHGEAERNDMVEYFGEQLLGYVFSQHGWVQSYGSRCVKPPIIFGDISRPSAMTVAWTQYAQSLTNKPMKGMLTGPVTILNWSFVRDDQPRATTCYQIALAMRAEVLDLERAGVRIIQIDEAALREGLPLRRAQWDGYLQWAIEAFRITANGVQDETQIHTHMCYSEFNDIIDAIAAMDADVITIETSRSNMELLSVFDEFDYPNAIGPGVYDIHSPNIPSQDQIVKLMQRASQRIPSERLWVNPDCGLKTRSWVEVLPALRHMVAAAHKLREIA